MQIEIRPCRPDDLEAVCAIGRETYDETFRDLNSAETMDAYLQEAFNLPKLAAELANPASHFYFLYCDQVLAGYLKVNQAPAQSDLNDPLALEIERIYIRKACKGQGLGSRLMAFALDLAVQMDKSYAWLGVWEQNSAAIAFYRKMGFSEAGRHFFRMGAEMQSDLIMKKVLKS